MLRNDKQTFYEETINAYRILVTKILVKWSFRKMRNGGWRGGINYDRVYRVSGSVMNSARFPNPLQQILSEFVPSFRKSSMSDLPVVRFSLSAPCQDIIKPYNSTDHHAFPGHWIGFADYSWTPVTIITFHAVP